MSEIPNLHVCSTTSFSGKTTICLELALKFKEEGYKVGYFKPLSWETKRDGEGRIVDEDVELMKHVLNLKESYNVLSPVILTNQFLDDV